MLVKVIRTDGTSGRVRSSNFGKALKSGEIAAYHCSEGWIEVRRKRNLGSYTGFEKRKNMPVGTDNPLGAAIE